MKRIAGYTGFIVLLLATAYALGPKTRFAALEPAPMAAWDISLDSLDMYVHEKDMRVPRLRPDNESRILWADSIRKTPYSVVYLHGFSASPMESYPVHVDFARRYGCNLYLPLLAGHGRDDPESFLTLEPNDLIRSAQEAIAIGALLGDTVIVMGCSTGASLAIYLAGENADKMYALIMYSPNIALYDGTARLITGPWGRQLVHGVIGEYRHPKETETGDALKYWTTTYRNEGVIALQWLLEQTMKAEVFGQVRQPYFAGFYYKNESEQDKTISVNAIRRFDQQTATPADRKRLVAFPDASGHVITSPVKSRSVEEVRQATFRFAEEVLGLVPVR